MFIVLKGIICNLFEILKLFPSADVRYCEGLGKHLHDPIPNGVFSPFGIILPVSCIIHISLKSIIERIHDTKTSIKFNQMKLYTKDA
jgi:hypothetical protein